jgi:hypothetical protein
VGDFLPLITGSAGALVFLALVAYAFYSGKLHSDSEFQALRAENDELKKALTAERTALDEATKTGTVTNQLIGAIASLAGERRASAAPGVMPGANLAGEGVPL